jgi:hypothetical protein
MNTINSKENELVWRPTPWDEKVFDIKTAELIHLNFDKEEEAFLLLEKFEKESNANLVYGRFNASDLHVKSALLKYKYIPIETSLQIYLRDLQKVIVPPIFSRVALPLTKHSSDYCLELSHLGEKMFKFTRFHENPFIERKLADKRVSSWLKDMSKQDVEVLVCCRNKGRVEAFMVYQILDAFTVEFILGGVVEQRNPIAPFFWGSVIQHFKQLGVKSIKTTISAANNGVLSLYIALGFRVAETRFDYQKFIE